MAGNRSNRTHGVRLLLGCRFQLWLTSSGPRWGEFCGVSPKLTSGLTGQPASVYRKVHSGYPRRFVGEEE